MSAFLFTTSIEAREYAAKAFGRAPEGHPDFLVLKPEGKTAQHSIETVREMIALSFLPPHLGPTRFVLIEEADRLGIVCSNALLKTLEEPFPHTTFLLSSLLPLLPTLASRCQKIRSSYVTPEDPELEEQIGRLMSVRSHFPRLVEEIARLETLLEERKDAPKFSAAEKESYSLSMQEKLTKESEGEGALIRGRQRQKIAYFLLKAFKETDVPLDLVEENLKEMLQRTDRFMPFGAALESFFLECLFVKS